MVGFALGNLDPELRE
ncbi:hypothetical protein ACUOCP_18110, partial [Escherichia sp. R-CC3]